MNEALSQGDKVKFAGDHRWWLVRATSEHFSVLTRQADFRPKGELFYSVIDWQRGIRGPINVAGQGWDCKTDEACAELLTDLESGDWEVSHRNNVPVRFEDPAAA